MNFLYRIRNNRKFFAQLLLAGVVFVLDQVSKAIVLDVAGTMVANGSWTGYKINSSKFLDTVLVWNSGGCFGLFNAVRFVSTLILVVALIVSIATLTFLWKHSGERGSFYLSLVLGGVLGNARDRIVYGAVVDFVDLHLFQYHWPAFNVADSAILTGIVLYMAADFLGPTDSSKPSGS
jgi:signal peptidase II